MNSSLLFCLLAFTLPVHAIIISYQYDAADRLTAVNYNGTSRTAYGYDKNGSLLTRTSTVTGVIPPPSLAATYNGLITNATPAPANIGSITLTLLTTGKFTGKFIIGGVATAFSGAFDAAGNTTPIFINRVAPLNDYTLNLVLDVSGGTQRITGSFTDGVFASTVQLDAARYNTTTNLLPAGLAAPYTALLKPTQIAPAIPVGHGYATFSISTAGAITLSGKLATNTAFTQSSTLVGTASWPLLVFLHSNKGYLVGQVNFINVPGVSDLAGSLDWEKPLTVGGIHTAAFTTKLDLLGSRFTPAVAGQRTLIVRSVVPNAVFNASGGNLALPITRNITLDATNKVITPVDAVALNLTLTTTTGYFTGTFKEGTLLRTITGVLNQEGNTGSGFFPGTTVSGLAELQVTP